MQPVRVPVQAVLPREPALQAEAPTVGQEVLPMWESIVEYVLESARPNEEVVVTTLVLAGKSDPEWVFPSGCLLEL